MFKLIAACAILCLASVPSRADPGDALDTGAGGIARRFRLHGLQSMENGRLTEAISYFDRAIALYPAFIRAHFDRARALLASGQNAAAIDEFTTVIAAHPEYPMVYSLRAEARLRAGDPTQAIADCNAAFKAPVGVGSIRGSFIFTIRSLAYEKLGRGAEAAADFADSMKVDNGDTFHDYKLLNSRCYVAAVVGLLESAQEACDESIARESRNIDVYDSRGFLDLKTQSWDRAIADYTQSLYYRPNLSYSLYGRALARRAKGDTAGAATDMQQATDAEPRIAAIMARLGVPVDTGIRLHKA